MPRPSLTLMRVGQGWRTLPGGNGSDSRGYQVCLPASVGGENTAMYSGTSAVDG